MNLIGMIFEEDQLFLDLSKEEYDKFIHNGELTLSQERKYIENRIKRGDLCLVCYQDEDFYLLDDPDNSFKWILENILIGKYEGNLTLKKESEKSFFELVNEQFDKKEHKRTFFNRNLYDIRKIYKKSPPYVDGFFTADKDTKDFIGLLAGCSCGYLECGSDFAYIKEYELLIYAKAEGGKIFYLSILPKKKKKGEEV